MRYVSTRGDAPVLDFTGTLLTGLALDGGLYVPETVPSLSAERLDSWRGRPYAEVATELLAPFAAPSLDEATLGGLIESAYSTFRHPEVVPLRPLGEGEHLLELFWGPTLAFKDVALQLVGRLFEHELGRTGRQITIVGATSGDTGSAAIEACRDREGIELVMLHPAGRVSDVQRRQMTTVNSPNIHNLAIEGSFDDCQDLVKAMFADRPLRESVGLAAVNSINWARVAAQTVYYVTAAVALGAPERPVAFSVPTGNFGNIYAGHLARRMGVPIGQLIMASNRNDILSRFVNEGDMSIESVEPSLSPAMDIQVSSNFERLLWELHEGNGQRVAEAMAEFRASGRLPIRPDQLERVREQFSAGRCSDEDTLATIASEAEAGTVVDPHTAVGVCVGRRRRADARVPLVHLACAHPAKFADVVEQACGQHPALPDHLADLMERPESYETLPADLGVVTAHVRSVAAR